MQEPPNQGAFAVIDITAGEKPQHFLAFMLGQIGKDIGADEVGLMGHKPVALSGKMAAVYHRSAPSRRGQTYRRQPWRRLQ
jgi:hypothetical protein